VKQVAQENNVFIAPNAECLPQALKEMVHETKMHQKKMYLNEISGLVYL
jgi:hypothetical protein